MDVIHKEDCKFKGFHKHLTKFDLGGPDSRLEINEDGIEYQENIHTCEKEDFTISFNFCPVCGIPYNSIDKYRHIGGYFL